MKNGTINLINLNRTSIIFALTIVGAWFTNLALGQNIPELRGDVHFVDGTINTGAPYHAFSGRISRTVVDLAVAGSVGRHPLSLNRTMRNWVTERAGISFEAAGCSANWEFNIQGYRIIVTRPNTGGRLVFLKYPDGTEQRAKGQTYDPVFFFGTGDRVYLDTNDNVQVLKLQDGSNVYFRPTGAPGWWITSRIDDLFGSQVAYTTNILDDVTIEYRITDASGRWLRLLQVYDNASGLFLPTRAETSSGAFVDYTCQVANREFIVPTVNRMQLTEARYSDGTTAQYEYTVNGMGVFPHRCFDTRNMDSMPSVEYSFNTQYITWAVVSNGTTGALYNVTDIRFPGSSVPVTTRMEGPGGPVGFFSCIETRGDGATRVLTPGGTQRVISSTDFCGNQTSFGYSTSFTATDALNRVTSVEYPPAVQVQHDNSFNVTGIIENPKKITYPNGTSRQWTYTDQQSPYYIYQYTDELGHITTYDRYSNGMVRQITYPDSSAESWEYNQYNQPTIHHLPNGACEWFEYDNAGLLLSHWLPSFNGQQARAQCTYYPEGHVWKDRLHTVTDPAGRVTTYEYDLRFVNGVQGTEPCSGRGLVTKIINHDSTYKTFGYDVYGNKVWEENELRQRTTYTYDSYNRVRTVTDPLGNTTETQYGADNNEAMCRTANAPRFVIAPSGRKTEYRYDANLRKTEEITWPASAEPSEYWFVAELSHCWFSYDAVGNLISTSVRVEGSQNRTTTFEYDSRNRKVAQYAPESRTTRWIYDAVGNVTQITNPDGTVTSKTYDSMNRVLTSTDEMGRVTTYTYWPSGQVKTIADPRGSTYLHTYDASGRLIQRDYPAANGVGYGSNERWEFNADGTVAKHYNRSGDMLTYHYDNRGREDSKWWKSDYDNWTCTAYDAAGRVTYRENASGTLNYIYDAAGQVTSETQNEFITITYHYDADGRRTDFSFDGPGITNGSFWQGYSYDAAGRLAAIGAAPGDAPTASYTYYDSGERKRRTSYNGTVADYAYDGAGRLNYLHNYRASDGSWIQLQRYGYDLRDRRTWQLRDDYLGDTYQYQDDSELIGYRQNVYRPDQNFWNTAARTDGFAYDASGNRTSRSEDGAVTSYQTDALNQYTSVTDAAIAHNDGRGNLTQWKDWTYTYDSDNRLISAGKTGYQVHFYYDAMGRLSSIYRNGIWESRFYDGNQMVAKIGWSNGWSVTDRTVWGPAPDEVISRWTPSNGWLYYHQDAIGSPIAVTDSEKNVVERYMYDAFGQEDIRDANGNGRVASVIDNPWFFTGQELMGDIGLYNYKNRFYHADLGRFIQQDPVRFDAGDLNLYRYCGNDPFNRTDPTGNDALTTTFFMETFIGSYAMDFMAAPLLEAASDDIANKSAASNSGPNGATQKSVTFGWEPEKDQSRWSRFWNGELGRITTRDESGNLLSQTEVMSPCIGGTIEVGLGGAKTVAGGLEQLHRVYIGVSKEGVVMYVGRTVRAVTVRASEHIAQGAQKARLVYQEVKEFGGMTLKEARAAEQELINRYGGPAKQLLNKINSVAEKYWDEYGIK